MKTLLRVCLAGCMLAAIPAGAEEALRPLDIKLPEPWFGITPLDYWSENFDYQGVPREPFLAPRGTTNVALHKPVTSSDKNPTMGRLEMITDGDKSFEDRSLVELGKGLQWVQIDLKAKHSISAVVVWHFHKSERVYFDVIVKSSNDPEFASDFTILYNNDLDNSAKMGVGKDQEYVGRHDGRLIDAKGVEARYIRLYSNGNTANDRNHYIEVDVYGRPVE